MFLYHTFSSFLKDRGCEDAFNSAFEKANPGYRLDETLWEILSGDEYFFSRAFNWSQTAEGREFWLEIDKEWEKTCNVLTQN